MEPMKENLFELLTDIEQLEKLIKDAKEEKNNG